ncbi:MAG: cobyric acid synthase [Acidimicrobiaceae bacterium]|nr:cobyric acid synthase [Acidimicrobiaceae bacterium]MXZ99789.1 cobyric acid synthase [Acidimicrobiaceae bacterium]MYE75684.1 cobyric acid synthase [Acidimicrobiaceae bacterium]MYE97276.1 cobyric acid synthase [Acidimicrobiaceae bacterium]MYH43142.1 cobyric acid synthase [Acidimicrobiaceae bacterium]
MAAHSPSSGLAPGLMVCGTASNAGKSTLVAGLCRLLARRGLRVAPFKSQNMALNSAVTLSGHEIGRAQFSQAQAAGVEATVDMNPVLIKPTSDTDAQVVVNGRPYATMSAAEYHKHKPELFEMVLDSLARLRRTFDAVVAEGAGSPAEINLAPTDIVNLRVAERGGMNAIVVGDIDLGGVFASLYGTVALLPTEQRRLVRGFVINKFRGDPQLLGDATADLEKRCGIPTIGVLPMLEDVHIDTEDSVALRDMPIVASDTDRDCTHRAGAHPSTAQLNVAVIAYPCLSNFTDLDPLANEGDVSLRFVRSVRELGHPDLIVLGGSKATAADLEWMRTRGLDQAVATAARKRRSVLLGICGGYQMLGRTIDDDVESRLGVVEGMGLLDVETRFEHDKMLAHVSGTAFGAAVTGYQIHHGRVRRKPDGTATPWLWFNQEPDGWCADEVYGTTLHGLFESDDFRRAFLTHVATLNGCRYDPDPVPFSERRQRQFDAVADAMEECLDMSTLLEIMGIS